MMLVAAAIRAAIYQIMTRLLAGVDSINTRQLYGALVATIGVAPMARANWQTPGDTLARALFAAMGVFGWLGHLMLTVAHRPAPASMPAPFGSVEMICMTASGWFVFAPPPSVWILAGALIIMDSGCCIWRRERQFTEQT